LARERGESQKELNRVPIRDNGEPLVDFLVVCPRLRFAPQHPIFDFPRVHLVRRSVAEMLCQAAAALPRGLYLNVVEGYRALPVQRAMYQWALERARRQYPTWSEAHLRREANRYSAPPDARTPPPHSTGAAVDVEIVDENGTVLDFSSPFGVGDLRQTAPNAPGLSEEARANRALLRSVLEPTRLTNYVGEWWHWSYGDSGWALRVGANHAFYGFVDIPPDAEWIGDMSKLPD